MTNLDTFLRQAADIVPVPHGLAAMVVAYVEHRSTHEQNLRTLRWGLLLCGSVAMFFYLLSILLVDLLASQTPDIIGAALEEPSLLSMKEGWLALGENLPLISFALTAVCIAVAFLLLRKFLSSLPHSSPRMYAV